MGKPEIEAFLTHLATNRNVSASTQYQALAVLLFLYTKVFQIELPWLDELVRAKRSSYLPVVLSMGEAQVLFEHLNGTTSLLASLL